MGRVPRSSPLWHERAIDRDTTPTIIARDDVKNCSDAGTGRVAVHILLSRIGQQITRNAGGSVCLHAKQIEIHRKLSLTARMMD
jgi:hypothetical protein